MNISRLSLLLAFAGFGLTACDNVDEGERFEGPLDLEEVLAKSEKNVLIEDFTVAPTVRMRRRKFTNSRNNTAKTVSLPLPSTGVASAWTK